MRLRKLSLEETLDRCLVRLSGGSEDIEQCLAEYPDWSSELRPLLEAAVEVGRARPAHEPDRDYARLSEIRLLNQIPAAPAVRVPSHRRPGGARVGNWVHGPALAALLVAAISLGSLGVARASASALPGDGLYAVKRGLEEVRLGLNLDPAAESALLGGYADERLREVESLVAQGRTEDLLLGLEAYTAAVDRLAGAVDVPSARGADDVTDKLTQHIAVLEEVQNHVPEAAREAIERVIERSIDAETNGRPPTQTTTEAECPSEEPDCGDRLEADQDLRMADQIAHIYHVSPEEALAVFSGDCAQDWKCVRSFFRDQSPGNPHQP